jgi:hypothetical protein
MPIRGNQFVVLPPLPTLFQDPTWNSEDCACLETLRARFPTSSLDMLACWVWKRKVPGLSYTTNVEEALTKMA